MTWKSAFLIVAGVMMLFAPIVSGGTRTVSWSAVTTYTDNTVIETANQPVLYDVWYVDSVTSARTTVTPAGGTSATSQTFNDASMVKGRLYNFYGKARTQDGSASADSSAYGWTVPFQVPKTPTGITVQ